MADYYSRTFGFDEHTIAVGAEVKSELDAIQSAFRVVNSEMASLESTGSTGKFPIITSANSGQSLVINSTGLGYIVDPGAKGFRNKLVNGDFQIWQHGTSFTTDAANTIIYTADQIYAQALYPGNGATQTITKETSIVPSGATACLKSVVSTAVPTNFGRMLLGLTLEDKESQKLAGKVVTASMQVRGIGNIDKIQLVSLYSTSGGKAAYGTTQIALTASTINTSAFTRITLTFTVPSAATLTASGTLGLYANYSRSSNVVEAIGDGIYLGDVTLEEGSTATPIERPPYWYQLAMCLPFFRKQSVWVGQNTDKTCFPIMMRVTPTISGGGSGFDSTGTTADTLICYQTTRAAQTLTLSAEL